MKTKTLLLAAIASVFAVTATAPSFAATKGPKSEKKIARQIARMDTNGDGRVSRDEMHSALASTFRIVDTNRDGGISQDEIANAKAVMKDQRKRAKAAGDARFTRARLPAKRLNKHFDRLDANGDGRLAMAELSRVADRMFKRADRNKDGYITAIDLRR